MQKRAFGIVLLAVVTGIIITIFFISRDTGEACIPAYNASRPSLVLASPPGYVGFPSLHLVSELNPFEVDRHYWHDGAAALWGAEDGNFENVDVRIRGRGNSTWVRGAEKRPLRIRFSTPRHMFGSDYAHRDWLLIANLFDPSLVRNHSAKYLASLLDNQDFAPMTQFVHLYVNGEYWGVYEFSDERDPAPGRAPLVFDPAPSLSEYMFELDGHLIGWRAHEFVEGEDFFTVASEGDVRAYDIRYPRQRDWDGHLEYLRDFVHRADEAILSRDFDAISAVIDIPSFVDFYLVQELTKNIDVGTFSVFMSLRGQGDERRIHFGPVWDFDRSSGNTLYWTAPQFGHASVRNVWFRNMMAVPEIFDIVAERWNEVKDGPVRQMVDSLYNLATTHEHSFLRNFERHNVLGASYPYPQWYAMLPQETREIDTHQGQVSYLLAWYNQRIDWLDAFFNRTDYWINAWWEGVLER